MKKYKLGELITQRREKYDGKETLCSWGVSRDGFIRPKQEDADISIYNVFYRNDFVFSGPYLNMFIKPLRPAAAAKPRGVPNISSMLRTAPRFTSPSPMVRPSSRRWSDSV